MKRTINKLEEDAEEELNFYWQDREQAHDKAEEYHEHMVHKAWTDLAKQRLEDPEGNKWEAIPYPL